MSKAWTDKNEYKLLAGELATSEGRDFERLSLPLIRLIWSETITPTAMGSYDRMGADHLVWADREPFELVVQCKGFKVPEEEIGKSQIQQCLTSIQSFRKSGRRAKTYLLIHNRTGKSEEFRQTVGDELKALVESGLVDRAELWDRQRFLREAFNKLLESVRSSIALNASTAQLYSDEKPDYEFLEHVPFQLSHLRVSALKLSKASPPQQLEGDPSTELLKSDESNLILMIGEAGFGKTTAALRTFGSGRQIFYAPGAMFSSEDPSTKAFLQQAINLDPLLTRFRADDLPTVKRILKPVVEQVLKERKNPLVLIIDGLDESIYFSYRGGLQWLFNHLREVLVPVVLLARTEFWQAKLTDFTTSIGEVNQKGGERRRIVKLIELLPWTTRQIGELSKRYRDTLVEPAKRARLNQLIETIEDGSYTKFYGSIPSRPLFLRFILDTVAERDVHQTGKAQLFYEWARMKIARDVVNPMKWGRLGRAPIVGNTETVDATIRLSFEAMMLAAVQMTGRNDKVLELLPSCPIDDVLLSNERLKGVTDPTGLFLNSLLIPASPSLPHEPIRIRFSHRAYQEFFLALYLKEHPETIKGIEIPDSIAEHLRDMDIEGIRAEP
jgi:hypothetical protein